MEYLDGAIKEILLMAFDLIVIFGVIFGMGALIKKFFKSIFKN